MGVVAAAFGSHGLKKRPGITPDNIHAWETASHFSVRIASLVDGAAESFGVLVYDCRFTTVWRSCWYLCIRGLPHIGLRDLL